MRYPRAIENLINQLSKLPSVGPKTAERYVFYLLQQSPSQLTELATAISSLLANTTRCDRCLMIAEENPCSICRDPQRQSEVLCVVENTQDLLSLEATKQYSGRYFVLGGLINTILEIGPNDLNITALLNKIKAESIKELILAFNFNLEGEATALYLNKLLRGRLKITRLAKGLPAGSDLEYADEHTLASALKNRNELS